MYFLSSLCAKIKRQMLKDRKLNNYYIVKGNCGCIYIRAAQIGRSFLAKRCNIINYVH